MNIIGNNIKRLRKSRGLTQQQLADIVGAKTYTTITKWEKGDNTPQGKDLIVLSKYFNVTVDSILGIDNCGEIIKEPTTPYHYFPTTISAGLPLRVDGITENNVEEITLPDSALGKWAGDPEIFVTKVNGDSMNKVIPDKSLIAVKPVELHQLKEGDIVVYSNGGDFSVKRFYLNGDEIVFRPDSHDSSFFEQRYKTTDNITIHGKVVVYIVELD